MDFSSLPPDALISILCRCPASSHEALRSTCKVFRATLDSDAFCSERAVTGWAEVTTHLQSGEELFDEQYPDGPEVSDDENDDSNNGSEEAIDARRVRREEKKRRRRKEELEEYYSDIGSYDSSYGYHDIHILVLVDGIDAGTISAVIIPRYTNQTMFHEAADAHSQELQEVGWTLCDASGRPRVKSIKDADVDESAVEGGLVHIVKVSIKQSYRANDCTEVVARALRSALSDPKLEGWWTLATAISDYSVYMTDEETKRQRELRWSGGADDNDDDSEKRKSLRARQNVCSLIDTRTFMRVGYKQIPEVVGAEKEKPVWLFALPQNVKNPLLSIDDALQIKLHVPPELPPEPKGVDDELYQLVKKSSNAAHQSLETSRAIARESKELDTQLADMMRLIQAGRPEHVPEERWEGMTAPILQARAKKDEMSQKLNDLLAREQQNLKDLTDKLKNEAGALVREKGASVMKSFSLHCACRLRIREFFDLLLDLVPPSERLVAISQRDTKGTTPLHCLVMGIQGLELSNAEDMYSFVEHLVNLDADRDAKDTFDLTPLGMYRSMMSERFEYEHAFGMTSNDNTATDPYAWLPFHTIMEHALKPPHGETDADEEAKPSAFEEDNADWDEEMDDEIDDEMDDEMDDEEDEDEDENDEADDMEDWDDEMDDEDHNDEVDIENAADN